MGDARQQLLAIWPPVSWLLTSWIPRQHSWRRSTQDDIERRPCLSRNEDQLPAVVIPHDSSREREADSPSLLLRREPRLEDLLADLARDAGSGVGDADADSAL